MQASAWPVLHSELSLQGAWAILDVFFAGLFAEAHQTPTSGRRWLISGTSAKTWQLKLKATCLLSNWNWAMRVWIQCGCQSAGAGDGVCDSAMACLMSLWNYKSTACYPKRITSLARHTVFTQTVGICENRASESNHQAFQYLEPPLPTIPRDMLRWLQGMLMEEARVLPVLIPC